MKVKLVLGLLLLLVVQGCGTGSSNDQGVSFLLTGFYEDTSGSVGVTGFAMPLTDLTDNEPSSIGTNNLITYVGLQNNLAGQFIRTQRVFISYVIGGATSQPPSTSSPLTTVLGSSTTNGNSSLPPTAGSSESKAYAGIALVPSDVRAWLALNRASLPEPPFEMDVSVFVRGVTSSGNTVDTNAGSVFVQVTPDESIIPTPPNDAATGAVQ